MNPTDTNRDFDSVFGASRGVPAHMRPVARAPVEPKPAGAPPATPKPLGPGDQFVRSVDRFMVRAGVCLAVLMVALIIFRLLGGFEGF